MSSLEPVLNFDDLRVETIGVVPAASVEDLTQGYGLTELGASCGENCFDDRISGSCECNCNLLG